MHPGALWCCPSVAAQRASTSPSRAAALWRLYFGRANIHWGRAGKRWGEGGAGGTRLVVGFPFLRRHPYSPLQHYRGQPMEAASISGKWVRRELLVGFRRGRPRPSWSARCTDSTAGACGVCAGTRPCNHQSLLEMLAKWVQYARLVTRTKETCAVASARVANPCA